MNEAKPLIRLQELRKVFKLDAGLFASAGRHVWAVNDVSLDVRRGETYGLVGESGSGKTTLAKTIVQLVPHTSGRILYFPDDESPWEIGSGARQNLQYFRANVKYIFQDPASSLDPRMDIFRILTAGTRYNPRFPGARGGGRRRPDDQLRRSAVEVLDAVGLRSSDLDRRPAEFSGGQRQRISLARALLGNPDALICDEVVSALDVSIQGQILNLLVDLKRRFDLSIVFIAHDLTVVSYLADRVGVLYGGSMMEEAPSENLIREPLHPYTRLLYESVPELGKPIASRVGTPGIPFNPTSEPKGCPFAGRCPLVQDICWAEKPPLREAAGSAGGMKAHKVACHVVD